MNVDVTRFLCDARSMCSLSYHIYNLRLISNITSSTTICQPLPFCVSLVQALTATHPGKQKVLAHREGRTRSLQITAPPTVRV